MSDVRVYESYGGMIHNNETVGDPRYRYVALSDYRALEAERDDGGLAIIGLESQVASLERSLRNQAARIQNLEALVLDAAPFVRIVAHENVSALYTSEKAAQDWLRSVRNFDAERGEVEG